MTSLSFAAVIEPRWTDSPRVGTRRPSGVNSLERRTARSGRWDRRLLSPAVAVRPIRIIGDPVLHTPTRPVDTFDEELKALVADMFDTMAAAEGVGLAANQVGVPLRLFVYDCPDEERR